MLFVDIMPHEPDGRIAPAGQASPNFSGSECILLFACLRLLVIQELRSLPLNFRSGGAYERLLSARWFCLLGFHAAAPV